MITRTVFVFWILTALAAPLFAIDALFRGKNWLVMWLSPILFMSALLAAAMAAPRKEIGLVRGVALWLGLSFAGALLSAITTFATCSIIEAGHK